MTRGRDGIHGLAATSSKNDFGLGRMACFVVLSIHCRGFAVGKSRRDVHARLLLGPKQRRACGLPVQPMVPAAGVAAVHVGEFWSRLWKPATPVVLVWGNEPRTPWHGNK